MVGPFQLFSSTTKVGIEKGWLNFGGWVDRNRWMNGWIALLACGLVILSLFLSWITGPGRRSTRIVCMYEVMMKEVQEEEWEGRAFRTEGGRFAFGSFFLGFFLLSLWMDGCVWMDGWMNERVSEWMEEWVNGGWMRELGNQPWYDNHASEWMNS